MKKLPRLSLSEAAYTAVKEELLSAKYAPGDRVAVERLCQELAVSRTPVWDALNRLETEGVVEIVPRKGVYLVTFSPEKAREIYVVRAALEGMATRLAAEQLTDRQLGQLQTALDQQAACLDSKDVHGYAGATIKFHDIIVEAAGNRMLQRLLDSVYSQMEVLRLRTLYLPTRLRASYSEHQSIFAALKRRDPIGSEREARRHIETTTADALAIAAAARPKAKMKAG